MQKTLALALKGKGLVSPNPLVGAIIEKNGKIVSRGYHKRFGGPHAEVEALKKIRFRAKGCRLFVNLEPCSHSGKTPPCTDAIIRSGVKEVIIGMKDPNPLVSGKGIRALRRKGIKVQSGLLEEECREINEAYIKYITTPYPFVCLKVASTLDGKIALKGGSSKWITGPKARVFVHCLRNDFDAVLVGSKTVISDDPRLNVMLKGNKWRHPIRIILDKDLKSSGNSRVFDQEKGGQTIVFCGRRPNRNKMRRLQYKGCEVFPIDKGGPRNLKAVLRFVKSLGISSVLVEGGSQIFTSFLKEKLADKIIIIYGNKIVGGEMSFPAFKNLKVSKLNQAFTLKSLSAISLDDDTIISGYLR